VDVNGAGAGGERKSVAREALRVAEAAVETLSAGEDARGCGRGKLELHPVTKSSWMLAPIRFPTLGLTFSSASGERTETMSRAYHAAEKQAGKLKDRMTS
jgi:hypothetical protein